MSQVADVAVVGAGAAGLAAAIFAGEAMAGRDARIVLLESAKRVGAKILISGGGRCNVTHHAVGPEDFHAAPPRHAVKHILRGFSQEATLCWFESLGVRLKRETTGKLFPVSNRARTVLDALLRRCEELRIDLRTDHRVEEIERRGEAFSIVHSQGELTTRRVILATGGRSVPKTGSDGHGWAIVQKLGHTVTPTYPALSPLRLEDAFFHAALSGVSLPVELVVSADGELLDRRRGELLWTHFGISGPAVLDVSRFWIMAADQGRSAELTCNLLPGESFETVDRWLVDSAAASGQRGMPRLLAERLPRRLADVLCDHRSIDGRQPLGELARTQRHILAKALTQLSLPVVGDRGWNHAEVTAGGVPLAEIDPRTMASRVVPGLYLIGEMLDCDGRLGGFNFQWAWSTGHLAGRDVGRA